MNKIAIQKEPEEFVLSNLEKQYFIETCKDNNIDFHYKEVLDCINGYMPTKREPNIPRHHPILIETIEIFKKLGLEKEIEIKEIESDEYYIIQNIDGSEYIITQNDFIKINK